MIQRPRDRVVVVPENDNSTGGGMIVARELLAVKQGERTIVNGSSAAATLNCHALPPPHAPRPSWHRTAIACGALVSKPLGRWSIPTPLFADRHRLWNRTPQRALFVMF